MNFSEIVRSHPVMSEHFWNRAQMSARAMVTIYIVLLFAIPSNVSIAALGSLGRPALLWGFFLMFWWALNRLQTELLDTTSPSQPVRWAYAALLVVALISFAGAVLRGLPGDQLSPAFSSLVRLLSWGGVLLVAADGLRDDRDAEAVIRRLVWAAAFLATFGLSQFATGQSLLEWVEAIPGLAVDLGGVDTRGMFVRASATATHPLEYAAVIIGILPLAISFGFRWPFSAANIWRWVPAGLIAVAALLSVSRSAIVGILVAGLALFPGVSRTHRWVLVLGGLLAAVAVVVLVPGVLTTTVSLFSEAASDPSTQSRTNALERVPDFISASPVIGVGFGTFFPRYYIFDNQWALLLVELGIVGVIAMAGIALLAAWSGARGSRSPVGAFREGSAALSASMITVSIMFFFFDALSFPMSAGLFFLIAGLCSGRHA